MHAESDQPEGIELAPGLRVPASALRFQFSRSSGPGGQNVNKVNTRVELWVPMAALVSIGPAAFARLRDLAGSRLTSAGEIHIAVGSSRSQESNRAQALERLRELILAARTIPKARRKTRPTQASRRRRLDEKRHRGSIKSARRGGSGEE